MRLRETGLVATRELAGAIRGRWFLMASASFLALSLGLALLGLAGAQRSGLAGFDRTTASLLNLALVFVPLLTFSVGALGVAGELEDGSLALVLAQPITRDEVFAGKFFGLLAAVWIALLCGFGATGVIVGVYSGGGNVGAFLALLGLLAVYSAATLAIGTLLSVALRSRVRAIGAAFAAWLAFVYVSDLGAIGLAIARGLRPGQLFALALFNPVEQARVAGTLALTDRLDALGPVGIFALDHLGASGVAALLHGLMAATAIGLGVVGLRIFRKAVLA
jgi:Cu-processing system permease protein